MIKAVIFDMDGVLIDTEPLNDQHMAIFLKKMGVKVSSEYLEQFRGTTAKTLSVKLISDFNLTQPVEKLILDIRNSYLEFLSSLPDLKPIEGIPQLITRLKSKKLKLAVASSAYPKRIEMLLSLCKLQQSFDVIVGGDHVEKSKPAPDIYLKAAELLSISADNCVVIEDAKNGILAAKNAGMKVIGFKGLMHNKQDLSSADVIIKNFKKITYFSLQKL